ncbi:MAG: DUF2232 domain-containing protein [Hyphomicrobiaceae bacterium]
MLVQKALLFGIAAGCAAAVVFLSATNGPLLARMLLYLITALPLFFAGLAHGWRSAAVGGLVGTLAIAGAIAPAVAGVFAASVAIPVAVLVYLVLLNRPASGPGPDVDETTGTEWYPIGRLVIWSAVISAGMSVAALFLIGPDMATLKDAVAKLVDEVVRVQLEAMGDGKKLEDADIARLTEIGVYLLPALTSLSWMLTVLFNLWLAGRVALASGGLQRPWPDIPAMQFPRWAPIALAAASLATFLPGYPALAASAASGSLYLAYVLMGLAVIHYITRGQSWRPLALWGLYAVLIVFNTGFSLLIAIIGLADSFITIRRGGAPPPNLPRGPVPPAPRT